MRLYRGQTQKKAPLLNLAPSSSPSRLPQAELTRSLPLALSIPPHTHPNSSPPIAIAISLFPLAAGPLRSEQSPPPFLQFYLISSSCIFHGDPPGIPEKLRPLHVSQPRPRPQERLNFNPVISENQKPTFQSSLDTFRFLGRNCTVAFTWWCRQAMGRKCHAAVALAVAFAAAAAVAVAADRRLSLVRAAVAPEEEMSLFRKVANLMWKSDGNSYQHVWPTMELGWQIVLGSLIGFFGAAFGSVGGVGGGGIFVPMLTLIIGFDPKSSTAISKCMIMGASVSTVYYNLKLKHPTLDMPVIDYDLAVLIQPMLMLGISIGVIFNVIFPDWLVTVLLIILFLGTSTKAFLKGIETWKKETIIQREAAKRLEQIAGEEAEYAPLPTGPGAAANKKTLSSDEAPSLIKNIHWKEVGLLSFVWVAFLVLQVTKNYTATCSPWYWVLNLLQVPVSVGVTLYEGFGLMSGKRVLSSKGSEQTTMKFHQVVVYGLFGIAAGLVGGLLGLGGGFIMGPLFLELGIPPQVSSATATFAMMFSSSMSVVEYYLLNRFPVPYAVYFTIVAFAAALIGQHAVRKLINWLGRASLIIFILAFMIFVSALSLGGVGISNMVHKIARHEYMGFENLCKYDA